MLGAKSSIQAMAAPFNICHCLPAQPADGLEMEGKVRLSDAAGGAACASGSGFLTMAEAAAAALALAAAASTDAWSGAEITDATIDNSRPPTFRRSTGSWCSSAGASCGAALRRLKKA